MLYGLCGISGVGKTTILNALRSSSQLERLVTYTTRVPRPGEVNHGDYHFVSMEQFQFAVQAGQLVCPISYRGQRYATALSDLRACAKDTLAVLRPDKIGELQQFTDLIGIYIHRIGCDQPVSLDDHIIWNHQHDCLHHVTNITGNLEAAVTEILALIQTYSGG